jgi:hypothetical protein
LQMAGKTVLREIDQPRRGLRQGIFWSIQINSDVVIDELIPFPAIEKYFGMQTCCQWYVRECLPAARHQCFLPLDVEEGRIEVANRNKPVPVANVQAIAGQ